MNIGELILKTREGIGLSREEIDYIIGGYVRGEIEDYHMAAWAMAVFFRGMGPQEVAWLTESMVNSGRRVDLSGIRGIKVDLAGGAVTEYPLGVYDYEFSSQEASLAYDREGNLAVYDLSAPDTPVLLIPASEIGPLGTPSWSPDGEYILITQEADRSPGSATQYKIFDLQGALRFHMEAERGPQEDKGLQWNPDGKGVLIHEVKEDGVTYSFFDLESGRQRELLTLDQNPAGGQVICVTRDYAIVYSFQSSGLRMTDFGQQTTTDISGQQWTDLDIPLPSGVNIPMVYPSQDGKSILLACDGADAESQDLYYVMELR